MHDKRFCEQCGGEFKVKKSAKDCGQNRKGRRKYCSSKCAQLAVNRTARNKKSKLRTIMLGAYQGICMVPGCGYDKVVDAHHIVPKCKMGADRMENGILLCPNHHREADAGLIDEKTLREWAAVAEKKKLEVVSVAV